MRAFANKRKHKTSISREHLHTKSKKELTGDINFVHTAAILLPLQPYLQFSAMSSSYMVDFVSIGSKSYEADFYDSPIGNYHLGQVIWPVQWNLRTRDTLGTI